MNRTTLPFSLTLRESEPGSGSDVIGTIEGRAVPYGTATDLGGVRETFARGAVNPKDLKGAPLLWQHQTGEVVGTIREASNSDDGAYFTADLIDTARGRDALVAMRTGAVKGLSIGFEQTEGGSTWKGSDVTRSKVRVREVSVATIPAYPDAETLRVRRQEESSAVESTTEVPTADLATREDLTALESRMSSLLTIPEKPRYLGVREALVLRLQESQQGQKLRALADVISSGNAGILPPTWSSEVRGYIDSYRYMFPAVGTMAFPSTGYTLTVPKRLVETLVGPRGAEKTAIPSRALTTGSDTYTAAWYAGGVDIAQELLWQSDPSVLSIVVESLFAQYAIVTDQALTLQVETAATPVGAVLDFTSWGTLSAQLITTGETIRAATGQFGDRLSLTAASFKKLIGMMDSSGRRLFAPGGATNSDGSAAFTDRSINIGGIYAFHNPRAAEDLQFNDKSARVAERPPQSVQSDNVTLMGHDVGILGAYIWLPLYPAGLRVYSLTREGTESQSSSSSSKK